MSEIKKWLTGQISLDDLYSWFVARIEQIVKEEVNRDSDS